MLGKFFFIAWVSVWNTENNGTLIIKIGPKIKKLRHILCIRTTFAAFEGILIADWQYDELEIPLKSPSGMGALGYALKLH